MADIIPISHYDSNRKTVGAIYSDAQKNPDKKLTVGEVSEELQKSLVEDLNNTIQSNPFEGRPFYIIIHEKRDLLMKNSILRRMLVSEKRPWPEDDTVVFYTDPKKQETLFCWCLPHWSAMANILNNPHLYEPEQVREIKAWKNFDLEHFGFYKDPMGNWMANPKFKDQPLVKQKSKLIF